MFNAHVQHIFRCRGVFLTEGIALHFLVTGLPATILAKPTDGLFVSSLKACIQLYPGPADGKITFRKSLVTSPTGL